MSFIYPCLLWWAWVGVLSRNLEEFCLNSALSKFPPNPSPIVFPVTVHPFVEINRISFLLLHDALPQSWWLQQCTHIISQWVHIIFSGSSAQGFSRLIFKCWLGLWSHLKIKISSKITDYWQNSAYYSGRTEALTSWRLPAVPCPMPPTHMPVCFVKDTRKSSFPPIC